MLDLNSIRPVLIAALLFVFGRPIDAADPSAVTCSLENASLRYSVECRDGAVVSRSFVNRFTSKVVSLPIEEFLLEFQDGITIRSTDCAAAVSRSDERGAELRFSPKAGSLTAIEVRVQYTLPTGKAYLRKQISVRQKEGSPLRLVRADLENWKGCEQLWDSMHADRMSYGSHPIFCEDLWAGVEFVAAFNEYNRNGFVLRSRPGGKPLGADWLPLHPTVVGAAPRDHVQRAFFDYIDDIRLAPPRFVSCYNTWWTYAPPIKEDELIGLARELKLRLFDKHGVFFDVFATDEGWADKHTIWQMNRKTLPRGFDGLRQIVESAGSRLGLWISPSAMYPNSLDTSWARQNGYAVVSDSSKTPLGVSLCDPRYHEKTVAALQRLIRENHLAHVKFDGFLAREDVPHDGLLPDIDSVEPLAERAVALLTAAKQANPELASEPTCFNSLVNYISPWVIQYADSVWGNAGGDLPLGVGPAPDYRESCTNAREWYIFSAQKEVWLPQNALQFFDIVHCEPAGGFPNHVAMAIGRGRFFLPVYLNPKHVTEAEWGVLAGLLSWAKRNQDVLRNTTVLPSRVEQGEPYAYAHWSGRRGIIAVRNPSNESRTYGLDLRAAGAPADLADAVCYTQYPYRRGLADKLDAQAIIPIRLAPWGLLFVEVVPRPELREAVAIGGRWFRDQKGQMEVAADPGVERVQILQPGIADIAHEAPPTSAPAPSGKILARAVASLPREKWLKREDKLTPTAAYAVSCEVSLPAGTAGKVLFLLEYPGRTRIASRCSATVNGKSVALEDSSSAGLPHLGWAGAVHGFDVNSFWAAAIPYASEWTWYICPVPAGTSTVHFSGSVATPEPRIGVWVWSDRDCSSDMKSLSIPCSQPEMPQIGGHIQRQGICLLRPAG